MTENKKKNITKVKIIFGKFKPTIIKLDVNNLPKNVAWTGTLKSKTVMVR